MTRAEVDLQIDFERQVDNLIWLQVKFLIEEQLFDQVGDKVFEQVEGLISNRIWTLVERQAEEEHGEELAGH
jgi:hypothetical protein